jgi:integrase
MGRPRTRMSGVGLLPRMQARIWSDGKTVTYRYLPVGGKPINLGTDRLKATRQVLDLLNAAPGHGTLKWVWERFSDPARPSPRWKRIAEVTRADYRQAWKQIEKVLGHMQIMHIDAPTVARYVHQERAGHPKRANTEKALLSNLFGYGITLGVCTINATIGVEPHQLVARTTAPDGKVLEKFLAWLDQQTPQRRIVGMAAEYASLAGNRKAEFLHLTWPQVSRADGVIRTIRAKQRGGKKEQIVEVVQIGPELGALLDRLQALPRAADCLAVFTDRGGNAYGARAFKTLWGRVVLDAIEAKVLKKEQRFTFHDLRAYYATRHKKVLGALPDLHANPATTARVYDRSREVGRRGF